MVKQNYLDIYPTSGIAHKLNAKNLEEEAALKQLMADIRLYFKRVQHESLKYYQDRSPGQINSTDTFKFFRSPERIQNTRLIIQHLMAFLAKVPLKKEIEEKVVNPFEQIKSFTFYHIHLLKENDVNNAILREHERLGLLKETNTWYYRGQINKNYQQILAVAQEAKTAVIKDYCKLFEALQRLSLFWFSVRSEDINRIRKSDLYLYQLTRLLMKRNGCSNS